MKVKYKSGLKNKAADVLLRCRDDGELEFVVSYACLLDGAGLIVVAKQDPEIQ